MTERQKKMLESMKKGFKAAIDMEDIENAYIVAQEMKCHYIGGIFKLAVIAAIEALYEKGTR